MMMKNIFQITMCFFVLLFASWLFAAFCAWDISWLSGVDHWDGFERFLLGVYVLMMLLISGIFVLDPAINDD